MNLEDIVEPLLTWYQEEKRVLPWREQPTFYHVWLSEIMLQQTRVEAVKGYYVRFLTELPTIDSLAQVSEEKLLKLWEGLGYYNRVRNLQKAAKIIVEEKGGIPPHTYEELLKLPGIGEYTAGAIASICYQEKVPAIDGNVLRVMMRIMNSKRDITLAKTKKELWDELLPILPKEVGDFNQALMELGATVCVPNGKPFCSKCPLQSMCQASLCHTVDEIPVKTKKTKRKIEQKTVIIFGNDKAVALQQRENNGLLAGMFEFPNVEGWITKKEVEEFSRKHGLEPLKVIELKDSKHIFSHVEWQMHGYFVKVAERSACYEWACYYQLETKYAIPTAYKTYKEVVKELVK